MKYLYLHPEKFETTLIPGLICLMKLSSELLVEVVEIFCTFYTQDLLYTIENYTALMVISWIDWQYYDGLSHPLKDKLETVVCCQLPVTNRKIEKVKHKLNCCEMMSYRAVTLWIYLYETVYMYFMPYLAVILYHTRFTTIGWVTAFVLFFIFIYRIFFYI